MFALHPQGSAEGPAGRFSLAIAGIWLLFLLDPFLEHWPDRGEPMVAVALVSMVLFAALYLVTFELLRRRRERLLTDLPAVQGWLLLLGLVVLTGLMCAGIDQDGIGSTIFIAVTAAMVLPATHALAFIPLLAGGVAYATATVEGWQRDFYTPMIVVSAGFVMWGVKQILGRNVELVAMREENERLLVEQERNRFARDLHDILGHSLTVITVKAELAGRLLELDPERARHEVHDLERLSRDALADVRRAVEGYRDVTLPGELARARKALVAAGIEPVLPSSADDVDTPYRELFAWAIREAVTNVIRHSGATTCTVELGERSVVVRDDGCGCAAPERSGNGLAGLGERAAAAGAVVRTRNLVPCGFAVEVEGLR